MEVKEKNNNKIKAELKSKLLKEAAEKPVRKMVQYDVFLNDDGQSYFIRKPDKDGDLMSYGITNELRKSDCIRLQFATKTNPFDVLRALEKIITWIKTDISFLYIDKLAELDKKEKERLTNLDNIPF